MQPCRELSNKDEYDKFTIIYQNIMISLYFTNRIDIDIFEKDLEEMTQPLPTNFSSHIQEYYNML